MFQRMLFFLLILVLPYNIYEKGPNKTIEVLSQWKWYLSIWKELLFDILCENKARSLINVPLQMFCSIYIKVIANCPFLHFFQTLLHTKFNWILAKSFNKTIKFDLLQIREKNQSVTLWPTILVVLTGKGT